MKIAENIQKLICLAKEHPELSIIAMVDGEIVGDDSYSRWVGYFGSVELGEFVLYNDRFIDDREEFKEQFYDYNDDELCKKFGYEPCINEYYHGFNDRISLEHLDLICEALHCQPSEIIEWVPNDPPRTKSRTTGK